MNLNNVVDMVEDLMGTEGSREAAKKLVDIVDRHYKCRTVDEIYFSIKNMDEDEFNKYWEKAVDSIEKEKLNQIIETAEGHNCPTTPNTFNYYCENCGKWICEKNLYKEE